MLDATMADMAATAGLALSSFLSATLLPAQSELTLAILCTQAHHPSPWLLTAVASAANTAGACVNYVMGRALRSGTRTLPGGTAARLLQRAQGVLLRYGKGALLFSWTPIIGDPLTLAAGAAGMPFASFLIPTALGKTARYAVLAYLVCGPFPN